MAKCTMFAAQMREGSFIARTITHCHTGVKTAFFPTTSLEEAFLLEKKEDWSALSEDLVKNFPGIEADIIAVQYERTVVKPKEDFFVTIASNQPAGPGYYRIIADSQDEARATANIELDRKWSMMYNSLAEIHLLDRKFLGVLEI